jgi:peptidoglycan/LPS O-acetylase OafA/YrhL
MFTQLRRITSSGNYIPEIDGVRFIAIMAVMIQHLHERVMRSVSNQYTDVVGSRLDHLLSSGGLGVMIFFALSGYILYSILKGSVARAGRAALKKYYWRRVTRLEPPYIIVTTVIFFALASGVYHGSGKFLGRVDVPLWQSYLATVTYLNGMLFGKPPSVNPPGWTLEIEVQFYVLAPLLVAGMLCCRRWGLRVGILLAVIVPWALLNLPDASSRPHIIYSLIAWMPYFLVGFVVFEITNRMPKGAIFQPGVLDWLAVGALLGLPFVGGAGVDLWRCLLIGIFLLGALSGTWLRRTLQQPLITNVGGMCYTIYLIHLPCIELLVKMTTHFRVALPYGAYLLLQTLIVLPVVLFIACICFVLVERPCMNKNWPADLLELLKSIIARLFPKWLAKVRPGSVDE